MSLSEKEREAEFPVHIELGTEPGKGNSPMAMPENPKKKYYPTLYISGVKGLDQIPEEGCALIDFKRRSITVSDREGEKSGSVELEICTLCLQPEDEKSEDGGEHDAMNDMVDSLAQKAGVNTEEDDEE